MQWAVLIEAWRRRTWVITVYIDDGSEFSPTRLGDYQPLLLVLDPLRRRQALFRVDPSALRRLGGEPIQEVPLDLRVLSVDSLLVGAAPVHVSSDICFISVLILKVSYGWLLLIPQTSVEYFVNSRVVSLVFRPQATVVHEHIWVSTWAIALVIKCCGFLGTRLGGNPLCNRSLVGIVTLQVHSSVAQTWLSIAG